MSDQSHSAHKRAALIAGIRRENIRLISTDDHFRMDVDELVGSVAADLAEGLRPIAICANGGSASTGSIDPLVPIADFCEAEGIWLHVDAAYGGFAILTERGKALLGDMKRADSIGLDAHKWFFQPFEAGALIVKNAKCLEDAFAIGHDVLQDTIWGAEHPNFSDRGQQLSRTARALKIWMSVQTFGMAAFRAAVQNGLDLAQRAETYVHDSPSLELMAPVSLSILCFRVNPTDRDCDEKTLEQVNRTVLARMFWDELAFLSSTSLKGFVALRMCIVNHTTTWEDVRRTLDAVVQFGEEALNA